MPINYQDLCGWAGQDKQLLKEATDALDANLKMPLSIVERGPAIERMMLFEIAKKILGKYPDTGEQLIGDCFEAGTKVLMANGSEKNVEDILIGEEVINHLNKKAKVIDVVRKIYTGNLITIKIKGWKRKLTATSTHDALYLPQKTKRFKYIGFNKGKFGGFTTDDRVLIPFGLTSEENENKILDLKDYVTCQFNETHIWRHGSNIVKRFITVNSDFAKFIGLYLAEGGFDGNKLHFSFNSNEILLQEEIIELSKKLFGYDAKKFHKKSTVTVVNIHSKLIGEFIKALIPGNIYNKSIPNIFYNTSRLTKLSLLKSYLDGDGYIGIKTNSVIGVSASHKLIDDIARLALSCKLNPKTTLRHQYIHQNVAAACAQFYTPYNRSIYPDINWNNKIRIPKTNNTPYGFARKIDNIETNYVENHPVYCITVDGEHTAIFNGIAQYNCVSWGGHKHPAEYLQLMQMAMGEIDDFQYIFSPYGYGCGRVFIGGGKMWGDGSVGAWAAQANVKYGSLSVNTPSLPAYSANVARTFGDSTAVLNKWVEQGKQHMFTSSAKVTTWDQLVTAITNLYPVSICSNVGFTMLPQSDGFHHRSGNWNHCMVIIGVDNDPKNQHACILNSWGDVHGIVKDFKSGEVWPKGSLRVTKSDVERILSQDDSFAYSGYTSFPAQNLPEDFFDMI